jgi:radical SAM superfamily enzyme YgiQ (UPF0313 family)
MITILMSQATALVVSAFEAELQPIAAASAVAALESRALDVDAWDAHLLPEALPEATYDLALVSVQQYEGLDRGLDLVDRLRAASSARHVVAFGQYAQLNAGAFLERVDGIVMDEPERVVPGIVDLAAGRKAPREVPGMLAADGMTPRSRDAGTAWVRPKRSAFPSIVHYPAHHTALGLMGNLEVTRGCHHKCTYCSVYGAYDGRVAPIDIDAVVADACELADQGARHFAFIDAEFLNSRRLGVEAMQRITEELGPCTFEFTTRVDHILHYRPLMEEFAGLGLRRVTSALEFPSDRILRIFDKGIDVADMRAAIAAAAEIGVELNPTFIPFTPWITLDELDGFEDFLVETGLARVVDPTALQTRLLLFKGSPLLRSPWIDGVDLTDAGFYYEWKHPDPRVEERWAQRREEAQGAGKVRCCVKC